MATPPVSPSPRPPTHPGSSPGCAESISPFLLASLLLLSAAGLTFEINLTRLFSVAQFYHFAFMIVSIALLGYGASGTLLAIFPSLGRRSPAAAISTFGAAASLSILGAYLLTNHLPFDSFSIAWDTRQVWILLLHYAVLALPFFFGGLAAGLLLSLAPHRSGQTYAINLLGSALGCLLALLAPTLLGSEGMVVLSSTLAALAALLPIVSLSFPPRTKFAREGGRREATLPRGSSSLHLLRLFSLAILLLTLIVLLFYPPSWLTLRLSRYKSLSYALQSPQAGLIYQRWNAFSRVDVVRSPTIHAYPGLSYRYLKPLPAQDGLTVDGDDLAPIVRPGQDLEFTGYLPAALAFHLRPGAAALLLEPGGGLDILTALAQGARRVTAVQMNPLVVEAAAAAYRDPRVQIELESGRSYLRRASGRYDVIVLSLSSSYHPVRSGAYSLAEDYRYTVEAFQDALAHLQPGGLLLATRWLQTPPSEELRLFALAVASVERLGGDPAAQIIALRGYNTATLLVKDSPFTGSELAQVRRFAAERAFDLVYAPGLTPAETNQYNILPEPIYSQAFAALLAAQPRSTFYRSYPFNVTPPTDDHPFFGHYFKWSQAGEVLSELGKSWQPFGGAGYFVVVALLLLALLLSTLLILLPAAVLSRRHASPLIPSSPPRPSDHRSHSPTVPAARYLSYFALIGLGFMLVEIPLFQRFILFLGHPAYAMTTVLFTLLVFSALGSRWSSRVRLQPGLAVLVLLLIAAPWLLPSVFRLALGLPLLARLAVTILVIAPLGFLMGLPFPGGILWVLRNESETAPIAWIWAVNGAASVVSSVLAALLALSFGLDWVLRIGALCYAVAWLAITGPPHGVAAGAPSTPGPVNGTNATPPRL